MNELIDNLRLDAGIARLKDSANLVVINKEGNIIDPLFGLEKFAELIVKECLAQFDRAEGDWDYVQLLIKNHFGVK